VFEKLMVELKRGFSQTAKYYKQLNDIQTKLSQSSHDEDVLLSQLTELKKQYEGLEKEKANIQDTLVETQATLAHIQENLDGTSKRETELRATMESLTCDKDTLEAMMRSMQREVADIESLTQIMEKSRELIVSTEPSQMGVNQVALLDNCLSVSLFLRLTEADLEVDLRWCSSTI